ncbi:hypothetical protein ACSDR0_24865 [Streptosporangium sp. G11]|uniref:hypothetical protein n=1 Tax=Streptosporangium sp. G11 TaxID=3436926 RepID=UPI003EBC7A7C
MSVRQEDRERPEQSRPLDVIGLITLLLTISGAVLIYMGWAYLDGYLGSFQLKATDMGFGVDEYALRGLNIFSPAFLPFMVGGTAVLLAGTTYRSSLTAALPQRVRAAGAALAARRSVRIAADPRAGGTVVTVCGAALAFAALAGWQVDTFLVLALSIAGPLLLTWPTRRLAAGRTAFAAAVVISVFCLLWAASLHAYRKGEAMAEQLVASLPHHTSVAIYSAKTLALNAPGVTRVSLADTTYPFRYEGLRLLMTRGDRYYLIPVITVADWKKGNGRTFVVVEREDRRVELLPGTRTG